MNLSLLLFLLGVIMVLVILEMWARAHLPKLIETEENPMVKTELARKPLRSALYRLIFEKAYLPILWPTVGVIFLALTMLLVVAK